MKKPTSVSLTEKLWKRLARQPQPTSAILSAIAETYTVDVDLIQDAFAEALAAEPDPTPLKRSTTRIDEAAAERMRQLARRSDIPYESLFRIFLRHYLKSQAPL